MTRRFLHAHKKFLATPMQEGEGECHEGEEVKKDTREMTTHEKKEAAPKTPFHQFPHTLACKREIKREMRKEERKEMHGREGEKEEGEQQRRRESDDIRFFSVLWERKREHDRKFVSIMQERKGGRESVLIFLNHVCIYIYIYVYKFISR